MSNCKPGDMAIVVRSVTPWGDACYRGAIVKVNTPLFNLDGSIVWIIEGTVRCQRSTIGCFRTEMPDHCLQPLPPEGTEGEHPGDVKVKKQARLDKLLPPMPQLDRSGAQ